MTSRLEIWAATPTPFDDGDRLDLSVIEQQVNHLRATGVSGAFVTGTTGEFPALSADERRHVVEAWAKVRPEGFGLGVQVGGAGLAQDRELAAHAESVCADFIASTAPFYGEAPTIELLTARLRDVAAAAPSTPFCYYHIPSMTGSTHKPSDVTMYAVARIPTLRSVKFTDEDLMEFDRTRTNGTNLRVYFGRDELLPGGLAFGADAVIGSLFNGMAPLAHRAVLAFDRGEHDLAFELHRPFRDVARASQDHGGLGFVKELMNILSPSCGSPRSPWGPLTRADRAVVDALASQVLQALAEAGADDLGSSS